MTKPIGNSNFYTHNAFWAQKVPRRGWRTIIRSGLSKIEVRCPKCHSWGELTPSHTISSVDGLVSPAIICLARYKKNAGPFKSDVAVCDFHDEVKLAGWAAYVKRHPVARIEKHDTRPILDKRKKK